MTRNNPLVSNILDKNYADLRVTRDMIVRQVQMDGVGASIKHAKVLAGRKKSYCVTVVLHHQIKLFSLEMITLKISMKIKHYADPA